MLGHRRQTYCLQYSRFTLRYPKCARLMPPVPYTTLNGRWNMLFASSPISLEESGSCSAEHDTCTATECQRPTRLCVPPQRRNCLPQRPLCCVPAPLLLKQVGECPHATRHRVRSFAEYTQTVSSEKPLRDRCRFALPSRYAVFNEAQERTTSTINHLQKKLK